MNDTVREEVKRLIAISRRQTELVNDQAMFVEISLEELASLYAARHDARRRSHRIQPPQDGPLGCPDSGGGIVPAEPAAHPA